MASGSNNSRKVKKKKNDARPLACFGGDFSYLRNAEKQAFKAS
jgi:hypothetical protein